MEQAYLDLLKKVLETGEEKIDRTGVGTKSLFGEQLRFDLSKGFPLITTKKTFFKPIIGELLWFLEGSNDERRLAEITYGTRDKERTTIWTDNAEAPYWKHKAEFPGDLGRVYGVQWRKWRSTKLSDIGDVVHHIDGGYTVFNTKASVTEIDQIAQIIDKIKNNPADRRMILTAFNVGEMDDMALPPCHMFAQFHVNVQTKKLNCQVYIRSNDLGLGAPFNIASYAILVHLIAHVTGYDAGELKFTIGDAHIYLNHINEIKEQLTRSVLPLSKLVINPEIKDIDKFTMDDIKIENYQHHAPIKMQMAV
jgi:thymidylate synthase